MIFVYRNLNRKGVVFSLKSKTTGLVFSRRSRVVMIDCTLKVSEAGRQRAISEGRRNVHAGIEGRLVSGDQARRLYGSSLKRSRCWVQIRYDFRTVGSFVRTDTGEPVKAAKAVVLDDTGCFALFPPNKLNARNQPKETL